MVFLVVMYGCESWTEKKAERKELMLLNCGVGEDSWESLGLWGDPMSPSQRSSVLNIHWKDWWWSWNSNILATWFIGKDPDAGKCWRQEQGMTEDEMVGWHHHLNGHKFESNPRSWWWTGKPGMLQSMGSERVRHNSHWTELNCQFRAYALKDVALRGHLPSVIAGE